MSDGVLAGVLLGLVVGVLVGRLLAEVRLALLDRRRR